MMPAAVIGNPEHLHRPDRGPDRAEQHHVDDQHHADTLPAERGVQIALEPVVRRAMAELAERFLVLSFRPVQLAAGQQHGLDAARLRAVRIFLGLALRMVLAMDRDPFLRHHSGRQPEPEAEEVRGDRMQLERPVGLSAVQEDRHGGDRDVRRDEREQDDLPSAPAQEPVREPVEHRIRHRHQKIHEPCFRPAPKRRVNCKRRPCE